MPKLIDTWRLALYISAKASGRKDDWLWCCTRCNSFGFVDDELDRYVYKEHAHVKGCVIGPGKSIYCTWKKHALLGKMRLRAKEAGFGTWCSGKFECFRGTFLEKDEPSAEDRRTAAGDVAAST